MGKQATNTLTVSRTSVVDFAECPILEESAHQNDFHVDRDNVAQED